MSFLSGVLTAAVFFLCLLFFFYLGIRYERKKPPDRVETSEQEKRKMEQFNHNFKELFAYDVDKALQRKKVD